MNAAPKKPADMTADTTTADTWDVIVLGAGPVGEVAAQYATQNSDLSAVLVERELLGGECSFWACMPSKALLRPVEVAGAATHLSGVTSSSIDTDGLLARRDTWVSNYDDAGQVEWAESAGLDVVRGRGRLTGDRTVEVEAADGTRRTLTARRAVVLATGSAPRVPAELADVGAWTSRDATGVREVPGRVAIVGAGVVACEAATWLAAAGAQVTMLVRGDGLLSGFEPWAGEIVADALRDAGVDVRLGTEVSAAARANLLPEAERETGRPHGGEVTLDLGDEKLTVDEVLAATGRGPALDDLGLDSIGLDAEAVQRARFDGGGNGSGGGNCVGLPDWLRVVGDASGEPAVTHWGKYRARVVGEDLAGHENGLPAHTPGGAGAQDTAAGLDSGRVPAAVPQVVFTDPQVASVGLTEAQAREAGIDVEVATVDYAAVPGASLLRDDASGRAALVVDRATRTLVGATFAGPQAGEVLHAATVAIVGRVPVGVLRHAVPAFPTASEVWLNLLEALPADVRLD